MDRVGGNIPGFGQVFHQLKMARGKEKKQVEERERERERKKERKKTGSHCRRVN